MIVLCGVPWGARLLHLAVPFGGLTEPSISPVSRSVIQTDFTEFIKKGPQMFIDSILITSTT